MADNTKIGPIFRGANGGLSDDLFTGIRNSFYYSNDMEIREDAKSIFPKPVPAYADDNKKIELPVSELNVVNITYSLEGDGNTAGRLVCTDYNIYLVNEGSGYTLLCTMTDRIRDLEIFNGYIYIATTQYLYYKKDNGASWADLPNATTASSDEYGRCAELFNSAGHHPLYGTSSVLCVGDGNRVLKVETETYNILQEGFSVQSDYYVMFINEMGGFVRVTANNSPYGSEVLLWDKVSSAPTEVIPLEGYHIVQSAIYNGYQYLLSDKGLGLLNGYQYYILKKAESEITSSTRNGMTVFNDKLYFVANEGLYIYGAKNKNYADVLGLWHKLEGGTLGAMGTNEDGIAISRGRIYVPGGSNIPAAIGINEGQATDGEIQTMCYFGTSMSEIKQSEYIRVGYHISKEGDSSGNIHIYYRTEADATDDNPDDWQWHEITQPAGLYAEWDMRSPFSTTLKLNCRFQWIQFKFVLTNCVYDDNGTTKTKDTNLYSADLYYNVMLE